MSKHQPILSSAKGIAVCTLLSRVTGLLRDMLLVHLFALAWVADAWNFAFQFPNLFRRLFGEGVLAAAFVPTFTRSLENDGREASWRLMARTLALITVAIIGIVIILELVLLAVWFVGDGGDARTLLLTLTALMLPFMLTICTLALFASVLNCVGSFVPAALAPIVLNLFMIVGILVVGPRLGGPDELDRQIFGVAISVLVAGVVQILILLPVLRSRGVRLGWQFAPRDPEVLAMLRKLGPVMLGQGILLFGPLFDSLICTFLTHLRGSPSVGSLGGLSFSYPLEEGALTALTIAARLYQFPLGVLVISLAVAMLPTLSRLAHQEDWTAWRRELVGSLRLAVFGGLMAGALMLVLAEPIVRMLFEYRNFGAESTARVAWVLRWYGVGLWAFCAQHIVLRGFYSFGDVRTPLRISCTLLPINVALSFALVWFDEIREAAFAISSVVTSTIAVVVGVFLLRRRAGIAILDGAAGSAFARMLLAAVVAGFLIGWTHGLLSVEVQERLQASIGGRCVEALGFLTAGVGLYLLLSWCLGLSEPRQVLLPRSGRGEMSSRSTPE